MYKEYDKEQLQRLHRAEMTIYKDFAALCRKHGIRFFAIAGTAIGAVRHQGFIPWDDDMDLAMLREDYERFIEIAPAELGDKYEFMGPELEKKYYNLQPAMVRLGTRFITEQAYASGYAPGIFLDLFVYESVPEDETERKAVYAGCRRLQMLYIMRNTRFFRLLHEETRIQNVRNFVSGCIGTVLRLIPHSDELIYRKYRGLAMRAYGKSELYTALCDPGLDIMWVRKEEMFPLQEVPFEDSTIFLIREYDRQLRRHLGDYMQIPPPEKRKNHAPRILEFGDDL